MTMTKNIGILTAILAAVVFLIAAILAGGLSFEHKGEKNNISSTPTYVEITGEREVRNNNVVLSDKYVRDVDSNANIIVLDSNGEAFSVREGTVLASDVVIHSSEGSFYAYRVDDPEKSVNY